MKLHMCCGSVYLNGYLNCDIVGKYPYESNSNPNFTDLENYFKYPFEPDVTKRVRREFIIDWKMDPLEFWPWCDTVTEIVMVSAFEHFEHLTEIPHIIEQAHKVLKVGGVWKFDFPDIVKQVEQYKGVDDEFMMELIYCNHKNKYSVHQWGYTYSTISKYLTPDKWKLEFKDVVKHDYPMLGIWATKI